MAFSGRPSLIFGPNVAQVRPMVHTRPVMTATAMQMVPPATATPLLGSNQATSLIQQTSPPLDKVTKPQPKNTSTVMVPPGRYKYSSATCNGQQGVYLIPITDNPTSIPDKGVFVPFNTDGTNPITMVPTNTGQQNVPKSASAQLASLAVGINSPTDTVMMNIPTILPQSKVVFNVIPSSAPGTGVMPATQYAPVINLPKSLLTPSSTPKTAPTPSYKPVILSYPAKNVYLTQAKAETPPSGVVYRQVTTNKKTDVTGSSVSISLDLVGNRSGSLPNVLRKSTSNSYIPNQTGPLSSKPLVHYQGQSQAQVIVKTESIWDKVPDITPPLSATRVNEGNGSATTVTEGNDSSGTESALSWGQDTSMESEDLPFKIDSVFSLCADTESLTSESPLQKKLEGCQFPKTWFVALEHLDLKGNRSIDVRKFRKFTGRQSCSKSCRQNSLIKLCRKQKLIVFENKPIKVEEEETELVRGQTSDMLGTNYGTLDDQIAVKCEDPEEESMLKSLDTISSNYKPGPKSKKLLRIKMSLKKKKSKKKALGKSEEDSGLEKSDNPTNFPGRCLMEDAKPSPSPILAPPPVTIKSTYLPGNSKDYPPIDTNSAAFKQAVSALGSKKFYLMRIEGKNILLPVEQNTLQPRAYILGGEKFQSSTKTVSPEVAAPTKVTPPKVKTEPKDTGYEQQALVSEKNTAPIQVKKEPTNRGYSDEVPSQTKRPVASTSCSPPESMPPLLDSSTDCEGEVPEKMPRLEPEEPRQATSEERIKQLKETLRKQQEALEKVRMMRMERSVLSDSEDET